MKKFIATKGDQFLGEFENSADVLLEYFKQAGGAEKLLTQLGIDVYIVQDKTKKTLTPRAVPFSNVIVNDKQITLKGRIKPVPVDQYSLNGKLLASFSSQSKANQALGKSKQATCISNCINGRTFTAYGFKWKRSDSK